MNNVPVLSAYIQTFRLGIEMHPIVFFSQTAIFTGQMLDRKLELSVRDWTEVSVQCLFLLSLDLRIILSLTFGQARECFTYIYM